MDFELRRKTLVHHITLRHHRRCANTAMAMAVPHWRMLLLKWKKCIICNALVINIGTSQTYHPIHAARSESKRPRKACDAGSVGAGASTLRTETARTLG